MIYKNCGNNVNLEDKFCPQCGVRQQPNNVDLESRKKSPDKGKLRMRIIATILVVVLLLSSVVVVSYVLPLFSEKTKVKETDTSSFSYFVTKTENVRFDQSTGIGYVDNELLLTVNPNTSKDEISDLLESFNGSVVGEIGKLGYYQVQFAEAYSYEDIEELRDVIMLYDVVSDASINYAFGINVNEYYPNDEEWQEGWSIIPEGTNWGAEAIDLPLAWENLPQMQKVNIGVMDTMFYTEHEDLIFAEKPFGNDLAISKYVLEYEDEFNDHGTHVAGIIGASFDNKVGIAGVAPTSNLYGVSMWGLTDGYGMTTINAYKFALYYLISVSDCKVVNISLGDALLEFCAAQEVNEINKPATNFKKILSEEISDFLSTLIDRGKEFIICIAAGNQNNGDYKYFEKDYTDTQIPYSYYSYSDFEKYINGNHCVYDYSLYENRVDEIKERLVEAKNIDANSFLASITDKEIRDRIIVVGAVENNYNTETQIHSGYSVAAYSQNGSNVNILAPGTDIYSTVFENGWFNSIKSTYLSVNGTSQATPFVTGVAGLIYSLDPDLSGKQVKTILCKNTTGEYGTEKYGILNANNAVNAVLSGNIPPLDELSEPNVKELSVEEARKIAEEHWDFENGDTTEEGYAISIYYSESENVESKGVKFYCFRKRVSIDGHWTTWDEIYINSSTGEKALFEYEFSSDPYDEENDEESTNSNFVNIGENVNISGYLKKQKLDDGEIIFVLYLTPVQWTTSSNGEKTSINEVAVAFQDEDLAYTAAHQKISLSGILRYSSEGKYCNYYIEDATDIGFINDTWDYIRIPDDDYKFNIFDNSSIADIKEALKGRWYGLNSYYIFYGNGTCRMLFDNSSLGTYEISSDKKLTIKTEWTTKKLEWDSDSLNSRKGWCITSDERLIIEGIELTHKTN